MKPTLIIGGGLAGLFTALKLAPAPCTVLSPRPLGEGASSAWAQGGIAAALDEGDTPEAHAADTVAAGAGLVDEKVALGMAREARERVLDLLEFGVPFDKDLEGRLVQSREAAHSARRIVRVAGDKAGQAIMEALVAAVRRTPAITVREGFVADELVVRDGRVAGVAARPVDGGNPETIEADAVVLATGGIGALFGVTTNPPEARGIGLAIAARAGAVIADPEFVQFHPTAIDVGRDPAPLATEALRGDGAILVDKDGDRFMAALHKDGELAPRDIVARGVAASIAAGKGAFLDARAAVGAAFPERFPTVYAACMAAGIDAVSQPIPIAPAEHYHMGGVLTDARGRTTLPGLWAAGEVASTGVHGANRLASNSLLEAVVFGARIAADIAAGAADVTTDAVAAEPAAARTAPRRRTAEATARDGVAIRRLRAVMQAHCGVVRDERGLTVAVQRLAVIRREAESEALYNMATAALFVAVCALLRKESRGGHFRTDHPEADAALAHRTLVTLAEVDAVASSVSPRAAVARRATPQRARDVARSARLH